MADEQLSLTIEQLAESVRTAMSVDDANEPLASLTEILHKETDGYLHEVAGQVFRSLLPAFVMTDADFKTPASLAGPTKAMYLVKDACVEWLIELASVIPAISTPSSVDRTAYRRRLHMSTIEEDEGEVEEAAEKREEANGSASDSDTDMSDDENTPPNGSTSAISSKKTASKKKDDNPCRPSDDQVVLDPIVALLERMAVRCPDKAEWRRGVCDGIWAIAQKTENNISDRFVSQFLVNLLVSDKAAWRSLACEACAGFPSPTVHAALLKRCEDSGAIVRASALKSCASVLVDLCRNDTENPMVPETIAVLSKRAYDEKPAVRRAAVGVFDSLVSALGVSAVPLVLAENFSLDESLNVRKAAVSSISALIEDSSTGLRPDVADLYAITVLHMVTDVETSVVEKVVESVENVLVNPLLKSKECSSILLKAIGSSRDSTEFARRILRIVSRKYDARVNKQLASSMDKQIGVLVQQDHNQEDKKILIRTLMAFLEELAAVTNGAAVTACKIFSLLPVFVERKAELTEALVHLMRTLCTVLPKLPQQEGETLLSVLQSLLSNAPLKQLSLVHDAVRCVNMGASAKPFLQSLLDRAEKELETIVYPTDGQEVIAVEATGYFLTVIGELAANGLMPSAKGLTAVEAIATNRVYRNQDQHYSLAPYLRACAMVAFGKICLQKESIAKRAVTKFAAHLSREEHTIVRNNVLIVLGDLCVVYTGLVDQYLPWVTTCLADPVDLIRFQAAVVVSALLAEDYIKFKGQIVFRLLYLLSDPNVKIRAFVESVFGRILFLRHSGSLKTLFAETVCALNGFLRHPAYQGAAGNREFLLTNSVARRKEVYAFMLTSVVTTDQKFSVMMQLAHNLLSAFVDEDATNGAVQIPEREEGPAGQVLIDTLWLLSHRALKFTAGPSAMNDQTDEPSAAADKKLFETALQKKTVVENIVPLLIQLNTVCEQKRSPISRYVRECLKELIKDYKEEIPAIVRADSQLAQELLFDLGITPVEPAQAAPVPIADMPAANTAVEEETNIKEEDDVVPPVAKKKREKQAPAESEEASSEEDEEAHAPRRKGNSKKKTKADSDDESEADDDDEGEEEQSSRKKRSKKAQAPKVAAAPPPRPSRKRK
jgi:hypothetical protein